MSRRKAKEMYGSSPTSLRFQHKLQKTNYILERRVSKSGVMVPKGPSRKRPRRWGGAGQHNADPGGHVLTTSRRLTHTHGRGQCGAVRQRPRHCGQSGTPLVLLMLLNLEHRGHAFYSHISTSLKMLRSTARWPKIPHLSPPLSALLRKGQVRVQTFNCLLCNAAYLS